MRRGSTTLDAHEAGRHDRPDPGGGALSEEFVGWVAASQRPLYAYIRSLVGPWAEPEDILQEVNLVVCRQAHAFDGRGRFLTWACRIAHQGREQRLTDIGGDNDLAERLTRS